MIITKFKVGDDVIISRILENKQGIDMEWWKKNLNKKFRIKEVIPAKEEGHTNYYRVRNESFIFIENTFEIYLQTPQEKEIIDLETMGVRFGYPERRNSK